MEPLQPEPTNLSLKKNMFLHNSCLLHAFSPLLTIAQAQNNRHCQSINWYGEVS